MLDLDGDPGDVAAIRDTIRLAFIAALQRLPARQRAALILCEVLAWPVRDVAELLGASVPAINSALQRARATMASAATPSERTAPLTPDQEALLVRYLDAFERYDMDALAALLHEDAIQTMPPYVLWLQGRDDVLAWYIGPGAGCEGSRLLPGWANGCPAFAQYRVDPTGGHVPWALQVLELRGERIAEVHAFLDAAECFEHFGFPAHLPSQPSMDAGAWAIDAGHGPSPSLLEGGAGTGRRRETSHGDATRNCLGSPRRVERGRGHADALGVRNLAVLRTAHHT